jgi:hypothetical protein
LIYRGSRFKQNLHDLKVALLSGDTEREWSLRRCLLEYASFFYDNFFHNRYISTEALKD